MSTKSPKPTIEQPLRRRVYVPTVKLRLEDALHNLVLAESALASADHNDGAPFDIDYYAKAARRAVLDAHEEIFLLLELSDDVLNGTAPDAMQQNQIDKGAEVHVIGGAR